MRVVPAFESLEDGHADEIGGKRSAAIGLLFQSLLPKVTTASRSPA